MLDWENQKMPDSITRSPAFSGETHINLYVQMNN